MSDETFLDRMQREARQRWGRNLTPDEAAKSFALTPFETRVQHLTELERTTPKAMTLRETAQHHAFSSAIKRTHERLRKVGR
jgi:hypothetical protein